MLVVGALGEEIMYVYGERYRPARRNRWARNDGSEGGRVPLLLLMNEPTQKLPDRAKYECTASRLFRYIEPPAPHRDPTMITHIY